MAFTFNAGEILDMAIRIEQNGARYYRKAAAQFGEEHATKMLNELAGWEDNHERVFAAMKEELQSSDKANTTFDPYGDLFVVYNHNVVDLLDRWQLDSNQLLVKVQYAFRM